MAYSENYQYPPYLPFKTEHFYRRINTMFSFTFQYVKLCWNGLAPERSLKCFFHDVGQSVQFALYTEDFEKIICFHYKPCLAPKRSPRFICHNVRPCVFGSLSSFPKHFLFGSGRSSRTFNSNNDYRTRTIQYKLKQLILLFCCTA